MTDVPTPGRAGPVSPFNRTAQHDAKRAAILSQAAGLFNFKGSRATTLRDIAASLGLTKTSLYYYVRTKEELIHQCYMATLAHQHRVLDEIERAHDGARERLAAFVSRHFEDWQAARTGRAPNRAVLLEIAGLREPHRKEVEARYIEMFRRLRGYLREGIEAGELRACEPTSTVLALLGSLDWTFSWLHAVPEEAVAEAARQALDLLTHGLYAGPGEYRPAAMAQEPAGAARPQGFDREAQNRRKQEAFYKTGTRFFNRKGFNGTSLDEIAEQLDVSKGAFYYHIRNKEDLLFNCYDRSLDIMERIHAQSGDSGGTGLERADLVCRRTFHVQNSDEGPLIRYTSITALPMARRKRILQRTDAANRRFGELLAEGIRDGSVRPVDTFVAQQLLAGAINAAMDIDLWRRVDDIDTAAREYFDLFFNGLLPRGAA